jgi:hypothetical protein
MRRSPYALVQHAYEGRYKRILEKSKTAEAEERLNKNINMCRIPDHEAEMAKIGLELSELTTKTIGMKKRVQAADYLGE